MGRLQTRVLAPQDLRQALALCRQDPVSSVLAAVRLNESGVAAGAGGTWGAYRDGELRSFVWLGANVIPVSPSGDGLAELAPRLLHSRGRLSSIVGERGSVETLWGEVAGQWPAPRQVRGDQPSLVLRERALVPPHPRVREARPEEFEAVLPASVAMFADEYGYSPMSSPQGAYATRVRQLIDGGRTFVLMEQAAGLPRVAFKADIGAMAMGVAQIQGVWVAPHLRGRGLGTAGMAAVVDLARARGAEVVSLYVNDYNDAARRMYATVGFVQEGSYATIVL
ncbi:hypothetical protein ATL40_0886 [Serinibacter salmoneus]|uniref:N-acetyltransferase domain-containing protein n=1 Tax=Serinibacter salmoneus TaxID=556530 RepID=A0A2A9CY11_9MICO|nr:hypothetical protein ATL40_0886 [Serinibacter salmoneus]